MNALTPTLSSLSPWQPRAFLIDNGRSCDTSMIPLRIFFFRGQLSHLWPPYPASRYRRYHSHKGPMTPHTFPVRTSMPLVWWMGFRIQSTEYIAALVHVSHSVCYTVHWRQEKHSFSIMYYIYDYIFSILHIILLQYLLYDTCTTKQKMRSRLYVCTHVHPA